MFVKREGVIDCKVKWIGGGMSFLAETGSNHAFVIDGAPEAGGRNLAPRPMEMLLDGTGGCTAFDVVAILKKGRYDITGCEVKPAGRTRRSRTQSIYPDSFHFRISGKQLKPDAVARATALSKDKYCSASIMLGKTASITHDLEIVED